MKGVCVRLWSVRVASLISEIENVAGYVFFGRSIRHHPGFIGSSHLNTADGTVSTLTAPAIIGWQEKHEGQSKAML